MDLGSSLISTLAVSALMLAVYFVVEPLAAFRPRPDNPRRIVLNVTLTGVVFAMNLVLFGAGLFAVQRLYDAGFGLANWLTPQPLLWAVACLVALDFSTWVLHWSMHKVPAFWRFHRLHHADDFIDVTTTLRQHPGETVLRTAVTLIAGAVLGAPVALIAAYRSISVLNAVAEHANFRLPRALDRTLALVWVTPDFHKMHHSDRPSETDTNYGNLLSLFDRVFGAYSSPGGIGRVTYGLGATVEGGRSWNHLPARPG